MAFRRLMCAAVLAFSGLILGRSARADVDLWPLLELDDDTTTVMYPFYVHEQDFLMVFPAYYRTGQGHEHHVLWPLLKIRDGRVTRLAPFWFSDDPSRFWILPLAYHDADETWLLMPPSYFKTGKVQAMMPLFVHAHSADDDWLVVGPRLFGWHEQPGKKHYFGGLLADYTQRANGDWGASLVPLFWRDRDGDSYTLWLAGYLRQQSPTRDARALYPLFASKRDIEANGNVTRRLSILWPVYKRKETTTAAGEMTDRHRRFLAFSDDTTPTRRQLALFGFVVRESSTVPRSL